ncbi:phage tail length tape measure family protein [Stenotrophomonas maltophilia]|uniref:phage tail length tape measure family protein n=1 Tax=Stenotrophomonas maltophilia TaxID=40324 RepID=UPI003896B520
MSRSLGTLTIDVIAEVGGFASGLDKSERRAEKWRKKVEAEAKMAGAALAAGVAIGLAGLSAVALKFGRNSIAAEKEVAQLDAIIRSTGGAAGYTRQQLLDMADTLADKSTFSGGEIVEAQTRLLSYSGILSANIPRAMQAVIDQSARLGISVSQSAETIGRALESPSKAAAALAQQGFGAAFTKEVRGTIDELVKAGKEGEAQVMILEILEESYAGAALAARDTFGGALTALGHTLDDITTAKDGSLKGATAAVNDLIDTLKDPKVKEGFDSIVTLVANLSSELANGVVQIAGFIAKTRDLANLDAGGSVQDAGEAALNEQMARLNGLINYAKQNKTGLLGIPLTDAQEAARLKQINDLTQQRIGIQRELTERYKYQRAAEAFKGVTGSVDSTAKSSDSAAREAAAAAAADADSAKQRIASQQQLQRAYEASGLQLRRQIELFDTSADRSGKATELQRLNFEMALGSLQGLNAAHQERLRALATEIDRLAGVKSANEEAAKATEAFVKLKDELNKKDSLGVELARDRLKTLQAAAAVGAANDQDYAATAAKVIQQVGGSGAADYKGPDALYGGSSGEFAKIDSAQEAERQKFAAQLDALEENRQARFDLEAEWNAQELQLREEHEANLSRLDRARWQVAATEAQLALGSITDVMRTSFGEQSALYKAAFVVQKAAAIAQSVIAIQQGMAMAAANPWPTNLAAIASVAAATAGIVSNIAAVGMAHDGIDSVPETGTWLLQKGERVTTAATSAKLDATLDRVSRDSSGGGRGDTFEMNFNVNGSISERERLMQEQTVRRAVALARQDRVADTTSGTGPQSRAMRSNWNVRRKVG